ncbi:MAG: T9SS type A sorting domain-containing protein [Bacteroidetes bacterium]|nr:T9SS type A sorting domain-containing protein [Bacteroidota bacterium]
MKNCSSFTDGTNVYQARALLRHYDTTEYFNSCEFNIPNIGSSNRIMSSNTAINSSESALSTKVFPNPASTEITITTELEGARIVIYTIVGQMIIETALTRETKLNVSDLKSGTYIFKIVKDDRIIKTDKLIINK